MAKIRAIVSAFWAGLAVASMSTVALISTSNAADFVLGLQAFDKGNYDRAFREWFPLALEGNPDAQFNIGFLFENGLGIEENPSEAATWYRRAAVTGIADAQHNLGSLYSSGKGVERDLDQAAHWFFEAARRGHPEAQLNIGMLYSVGAGVEPDLVEAYKWTGLAARRLPEGERRDFANENIQRFETLMGEEEIAEARRLILAHGSAASR